jgi:hypothetical protein
MAANRTFSIAEANALFKIKYEKLSENVYNSANVLLGRAKKSYNFTGKQMIIAVPQSFAGGVGSGSLPKANTAIYDDAILTAKKMYAVVEIDRETIKAALSDEGSFVRATKEVVKKGVESWMRNMSRTLFGSGTGELGTIDSSGVVDNGSGNYTLTISEASFKEADLEERDIINISSGNSDQFEIEEVDVEAREVTVQRLTGSKVPADAEKLFMQGSENNEPEGLKGVLDATSGTKYGITVARRWKAIQEDASGATISVDLMNKVMLKVEKQCGKAPNLIVTSYKQYEKLLNIIEDHKRYNIPPRDKALEKAGLSFKGIEFMSSAGPVGVFPDRFCDDDRMYFLNDDHLHIYHRPDFGWFDDDGTVFLRKSDSDAYEARYGGYLQTYISPSFHGVLTNLNKS